MTESPELQALRKAWIESGLSCPGDIGTRRLIITECQDGLQIAVEGSPIRGELLIRWQTSGDAMVWFRPYDLAFSHDFKRISNQTAILSALYPIVLQYNANLRSLD